MIETSGLAAAIRALLAQAGPETLPSGVLAWWGDTVFPDGRARVPALTQTQWEGTYLRLENAAVAPGVVKPLPAVMAATYDMRPDEPVPIAIASFRVAVPRPDLAEAVRSAARNGGPPPALPQDLAAAIEERRAFFATALMHDQWRTVTPAYRGRDLSFVVDERFHLTNPGEPAPEAVEVDLGDGGGFRRVGPGVPFGVPHVEGAGAEIAVRCHYGDRSLTARFVIAVSDRPAPPRPDETWPLRARADGGDTPRTGRAWVFRAPGRTEIVNPVIMVEGFPGRHPCDYMYELLDQCGTVGALHAAGYDLVIVALDDGMATIQSNAGVLVECIREVRRRTSQPLVVGGVSMGGLVSRYALAQMETMGEAHDARAYLSIDAPHGGTYTSLGVQWFVHSLLPFARGLAGFAALLDSPANQQLMIAWWHDGKVRTSELREELLRDLDALGGYPKQPRKLAVACGRADGVGAASAGARTLTWSGEPFVSVTLNTLPGDAEGIVAAGSWFLAEPPALTPIVSDGGIAWETVPGSQNTYNGQVAAVAAGFGCGSVEHAVDVACGVPTVSALDLRQDPFAPVGADAGPFDAHVCSPDNVEHLEITPEVSRWILQELGPPPPRLAGAAGARAAAPAWDPHNPEFLNEPYPTYERFRTESPVLFVESYESHWFFRYDDCRSILDDKELFRRNPREGLEAAPGPVGIMRAFDPGIFGSDPPRHTELRARLEPVLLGGIGRVAEMTAAAAVDALSRASSTGYMELVTDFALPVPANVVFEILGIPGDELVRKGLIAWQAAYVRAHDETQPQSVRFQGGTAGMALHLYLEGLVRKYRKSGGPGVIGELCRMIDDHFTAEDVHMSCFDFVVAGYLSTTWLIASGVWCLVEHPEQLRGLCADRNRMDAAIEEILRLEPPVQVIDRYVTEATELRGAKLEADTRVTAVIASANRDPEVFEDPDELRIDRRLDREQMAFGGGIHHCIGAPLARLMAPAAMNALLDLAPLEIAGLAQWQTDPYLRGLVNLPLRLGA